MSKPAYSDAYIRGVLDRTKSIALVGASLKTVRASWYVGNYMSLKGYKIAPINPGHVGKELFGTEIIASLRDIPQSFGDVHMVDIFRRSEHVMPIVEEAIDALLPRGLKTIWMQIGVVHEEAAALAQSHGLDVIMNTCPKQEYQRLKGELSWGGFNSGIVSSKLRSL